MRVFVDKRKPDFTPFRLRVKKHGAGLPRGEEDHPTQRSAVES